MSDTKETSSEDEKKSGTSRGGSPGRLVLRKTIDAGQVRQSFSHGRSKAVTVEVRRKRTFTPGEGGRMTEIKPAPQEPEAPKVLPEFAGSAESADAKTDDSDERRPAVLRALTSEEKEARARAFEVARQVDAKRSVEEAEQKAEDEAAFKIEEDARHKAEEKAAAAQAEADKVAAEEAATQAASESAKREAAKPSPQERDRATPETPEEAEEKKGGKRKGDVRRAGAAAKRDQPRRRSGKLTISQALSDEDRVRSLASVRRARERERRSHQPKQPIESIKIVREVVVPETIEVGELANRMAVRGVDVVKALMKMGSMATVHQSIDADTAEVLVGEFGHKIKRVSAADVEIGLRGEDDDGEAQTPRPAVVTVMGHVDHGKTSLLDALRETDVVAGEAGGITQHIGAYQVVTASGAKITFIDTPGHAAFTSMRARGAKVTDVVVLVVAADDGVMPQTIEAINHAKAAEVPMIVAINKMDKSGATPDRVRNELLQQGIVVEAMGGDVLDVEVSAIEKTNLDKLVEAILLQAEILELKANPDRPAAGVVVEARLERGRGSVATVLVQRGTLRVGDILVAGSEWARVRALSDERGQSLEEAGPSTPVEILGLSGTPEAGDEILAVESERRAREVADYRKEQMRQTRASAGSRGSLEQMFADIGTGTVKELPVVIKADVHGSAEAIVSSLEKLSTDEVAIRVLHSGVGGINESDITLAEASKAVVIGFNVRANAQARTLAQRDKVEIRYYSVIYHLIDELKGVLSGMLAPTLREHIVGNAQVLEVFEISKGGRAAGCRVIDGLVKRGATVRLLRDDTVLHEGKLSTLRRFKDDVREVKEGLECGMSFENYEDVRIGDIIEAVEVEAIARTL